MSHPKHFWEGRYYIPDEPGVRAIYDFVQRRKGWIYTMFSPEHPEWGYKIGFSKKDPFIRAHKLANEGAMHTFDIANAVYVMNAPWAEKQAHQHIGNKRTAKEWFDCSREEAYEALCAAEAKENRLAGMYLDKDLLLAGNMDAFMNSGIYAEDLIEAF